MNLKPKILNELKLSRYVALDIETTGLDYLCEDIIEFGAVRFVDGEIAETYSQLIKPSKPIPAHITRITHISDKDVEDAPNFQQASRKITDFIGDDPVVAHNVSFDLPFLEYHLRKARNMGGLGEPVRQFLVLANDKHDTLLLTKILLPLLPGFSLSKVAEYLEVEHQASHRALPDARAAGEIFLHLIHLALQVDFRDIRQIVNILDPTEEPIKTFFLNLMNFLYTGKYHIERTPGKEAFFYSANYYNIIGEGEAPEGGKLETEPIDEDEIRAIFDMGGQLQQSFGPFELRASQIKMAGEVARAFNQKNFLAIEAGTGTGKSMAYLLPAVKWSVKNYGPFGRVIISTNTKNLQEQLFFKDIPILHSVLKEKFKAVLLKGKANYLCLDKWVTVLKDMQYRLASYERVKILPLLLWVKYTETGDIAENNGFSAERNMGLWSKFIAENNYCPGKSCKYYSQCFLWRARNNARDAHLVLVNHSLLFSDLAAEQAVLSDYSNVILDEAHNIEKVATEYLGIEISRWAFRDTLQKLYVKERIQTGVLMQLQKRIQLSNMQDTWKDLFMGHLDRLIPMVEATNIQVQGFFKELTTQLRAFVPEQTSNEYNTRFRYRKEDGLLKKMESYYIDLDEAMRGLLNGLHDLMELFKEIPQDSFPYQKQVYQELQAQFTNLDGLKNNLDFLIAAEWDNFVYWFELPSRENSDDSRLYAAPLNIAEILYHKLYKNLNTAIFTSATLTVGKSFDYFLNRIGLNLVEPERLVTLLLDTHFNYQEQVFLAIPAFFPDPRSVQFRDAVKNLLTRLSKEQRRGTLVLFTAYSLLNEVYESLRLTYESEKIPLLAQGKTGSRHLLINQFKEIPDSVLFGTDSFWEGIDVPGKALQILVITKLPFDVPSEPIVQAKAEMIKKAGGNPFMEYTIPEAVIKFRQGFGRLIRSKSDFGVVLVLDNRIIKKLYGRVFLESLPVQSRVFYREEEFWESLLQWFNLQEVK
ncbi:MAG: helicase C-terminal domain-containing protein [Calditrichia bacterium]